SSFEIAMSTDVINVVICTSHYRLNHPLEPIPDVSSVGQIHCPDSPLSTKRTVVDLTIVSVDKAVVASRKWRETDAR
ncbi:Hypothetical predicted protein, partial [Olea europaea subsp. europaea]